MELLLPQNPIVQHQIRTRSISSIYKHLIENATEFNIATGFITNDSIAALKQIIDFRDGELNLSLFIGMNYLDGFTKLQYNAVKDLNSYLTKSGLGNVYLSSQALFHGKMYSFMNDDSCLASFVGSSNLDSFVGTSQNYIEADILFKQDEGKTINSYISQLTTLLGKSIDLLPTLNTFKDPEIKLLSGYSNVKTLTLEELNKVLKSGTGLYLDVPLKVDPKSNLNTYFGAGKIKGKYSPRGWYEVEIILGKKLNNIDILPTKDEGPFTVVTSDGYEFECSRQGDYSKNLRSTSNLKILGRWIKGQMENSGALKIGTPVTEETLNLFGKHFIRFEKTSIGVYILSLV